MWMLLPFLIVIDKLSTVFVIVNESLCFLFMTNDCEWIFLFDGYSSATTLVNLIEKLILQHTANDYL